MAVRVYLGTTEGPVAIERVTREAAQQSAICFKRTTQVLPVSAGYDAFVRPPSGVVEREFGPFEPGAFRLDVSAAIADGESWQLGVYLAHALAAAGSLGGPEDAAERAVWATGEVRNDLRVAAVGHLADKLRASRGLLADLAADGIPITLVVPKDNRDALADAPPGVEVVAAETTDDALRVLGLVTSGGGASRKVFKLALAASLVAAIAVLAWAAPLGEWWRLVSPTDEPAIAAVAGDAAVQPAASPVVLAIFERRAGRSCAAVHVGRTVAERRPVARQSADAFATSRQEGLCGLAFSVTPGPGAPYVAAFLTLTSGTIIKTAPPPPELLGGAPLGTEKGWSVDLPLRPREALAYRLVALVGKDPVVEAAGWLRAQPDWGVAVGELARQGISVISASHSVSP